MRERGRRGSISLVLGLACELLLGGSRAQAIPLVPDFSNGPIVFDFENGLQGWTLRGSTERIQSDLLGGEWAILGGGLEGQERSTMFFPYVALTDAGLLSLDYFGSSVPDFHLAIYPAPYPRPSPGTFEGPLLTTTLVLGFQLDPIRVANDGADGGTVTFDLSRWGWAWSPHILWPLGNAMVIDNITLIPIPEPSTLALVGLGVAGLVWRWRR